VFSTGAGSQFTASIPNIQDPNISFEADIVPHEPWATAWCGKNLRLAPHSKIQGNFYGGKLNATLRNRVEYAYFAQADSFFVRLWLDANGIRFPEGSIHSRGYTHTFDGEVIWNEEFAEPHFAFKLRADSNGFASVYGTLDPVIDLELAGVNTKVLPWADTNMTRGAQGIVSATLHYDVEHDNADLEAVASTSLSDLALKASLSLSLRGDELRLKEFEAEQGENRLQASFVANLKNERRLTEAHLSVPRLNLPQVLSALRDSTLAGGLAQGEFHY
jgi:hypothetical protein